MRAALALLGLGHHDEPLRRVGAADGDHDAAAGLELVPQRRRQMAGGTGELNLNTGGAVGVADTVTIWETGTINLSGGTLTTKVVNHTNGGTFNFTSGTLTVDTFQGVLIHDGGTLLIGGSPGVTDVTQNYTINSGTLEIELFGNGGGSPVAGVDFDQLTTDTANLSGTLDLLIDSVYTPTLGDLFPIISTTSGVSGTFGSVNGAYLGGGLGLGVTYGANDVTVEVIKVLLGDFDLDTDVDGFDFIEWQRGFGGAYDANDLADWETNYGTVAPLSATSTTVPEPTTGILLMLGLAAMLTGYMHRYFQATLFLAVHPTVRLESCIRGTGDYNACPS